MFGNKEESKQAGIIYSLVDTEWLTSEPFLPSCLLKKQPNITKADTPQ